MQGQIASRIRDTGAALIIVLALFESGFAQTVTWGVNGAGGSGTWDTTTANWYNGTTNVPWPSSGNAIFAGAAGGTVNVPADLVVSSMTFNTPGYLVQGGFVESNSSGSLTITTNADATFEASTITTVTASESITKNGPATLSLPGTSLIGPATIQVNQGALDVGGNSGYLAISGVNLANAPGVIVTLDPAASLTQVGSLGGGGSAGGLVQPANKPETVTLSLGTGGTTFGGILADNGAGILALDDKGTTALNLTGVNTYSGPTTIESGSLKLSGNGSATSTSISMSPGTSLELDDTGTVVGNRLSTSKPLLLDGANLRMDANLGQTVTENAGPLQIAGAVQINANVGPNPTAQFSFAGLTREGHAVLNLDGPTVSFAGLTNGSTGIVAPYVTVLNDWATVGADGKIAAFAGYVPDINTALATDNVRISSNGTINLAASSTIGSLNLQAGNTANPVLDLGGHELGLTTGGILASEGIGTNIIQNGSLSTPSGEFVITTYNSPLTINANILESGGQTALTKAGSSTLTLTGNNTYTGPTSIMQGKLVVGSDANLGLGTTINFGGATTFFSGVTTLQAAGSFTSAKGINTESSGGTINTNGFNLEFSGPVTGTLTKTGLGTLTLDNAMTNSLTVNQGLVILPPGAASSVVNLNGASLQASGALESLTWNASLGGSPISTLDIGGPAAATLTTGSVNFDVFGKVQVDFGIGSTQSDFWSITGPSITFWPTSPGSIQFEFQNLGGVATGVEYPLISYPASRGLFGPPSSSVFAVAPDLVAAGWAGTFTTTSTGVSVEFSRVPEPPAICLMALGTAAMLALRRRK